jgi:hypothetical protein
MTTTTRPMLRCASCGLAVIRVGDRLVRGCGHVDAAVVAEMSAAAKGTATLATGRPRKPEAT